MATNQGVGEIEPTPPVPQPPSWTAGGEEFPATTPPCSPIQERALHDPSISTISLDLDDYYDVMVVGMSGMGKSATADKIIIASKVAEMPEAKGMGGGEGQQKVPTKPAAQQGPSEVATKPAELQDPQLDGRSGDKVVTAKHLGRESENVTAKITVEQVSDEVVAKLTEEQSSGEDSARLVEQDGNENEPIIVKDKGLTLHNLTKIQWSTILRTSTFTGSWKLPTWKSMNLEVNMR